MTAFLGRLFVSLYQEKEKNKHYGSPTEALGVDMLL